MKVSKLIEMLQELPQDAEVATPYSGDFGQWYDTIDSISIKKLDVSSGDCFYERTIHSNSSDMETVVVLSG